MSEEIKNTPEEIEAVKAEDLEDTVEKENDAEAVIEEISTEEIIAEEPAAGGSRSCTCDEGKEAQTFL